MTSTPTSVLLKVCPSVQTYESYFMFFLEIAIIPTKRLRNQIAGFITHLMKRIRAGPVRGISIKLQEEER